MTPRLEAVARYHRHYKRLLREAEACRAGSPLAEEVMRAATIAYRAMVVEADPSKAAKS